MWWPPTTFTRAEIVRGIRYLPPASSLRSRYAYNNVMFVAAGEVVAAVVRAELGRLRARADPRPARDVPHHHEPSAGRDNVAAPHLEVEGVVAAGRRR